MHHCNLVDYGNALQRPVNEPLVSKSGDIKMQNYEML
jgi:hypothetical protein